MAALTPFPLLDCTAKKAKYAELYDTYVRLAAGEQEVTITDQQSGSTTWGQGSMQELRRIMCDLLDYINDNCDGLDNTPRASRRAIAINYYGR